eukprot:jgi/Picre1/30601/NNA_005962.t1
MSESRLKKATCRRDRVVSEKGEKGFRDESPHKAVLLGETTLSLNTRNSSSSKISVKTPIAADQPVTKSSIQDRESDFEVQGLGDGDRPVSRDLGKALATAADLLHTPVIQSSELPSSVPLLLKLVAQVSEADGLSVQQVWEDVRRYAQVTLLERITKETEAVKEEQPGYVHRESSVGISYVIPSESEQIGCESYDRLPPVTIRPLLRTRDGLEEKYGCLLEDCAKVLETADTVTAFFPTCEESTVKRYLLYPEDRLQIIQENGAIMSRGKGLKSYFSNVGDKGFLCFHYQIEQGKQCRLHTLPHKEDSLLVSNIQMAVTLKRGVGGTAGMKSEARLLDNGALLSLVLGEDPDSLLKYHQDLNRAKHGEDLNDDDQISTENRPIPAEKKMSLATLSCRLDLNVSKELWAALDQQTFEILSGSIDNLGKVVSRVFREINWEGHLDILNSLSFSQKEKSPALDSIYQHIESLLNNATRYDSGSNKPMPQIMQQVFLKLHVFSMALASASKKIQHHTPLYMISTRDCFTSDIYGEKTSCSSDSGCTFEKTRWFMKSTDAPPHYDTVMDKLFSSQSCMEQTILDGMVSSVVRMETDPPYCQDKNLEYLLPLGVTTYNGVYTLEELDRIEEQCDNLHQDGSKGILPKECYHSSLSKKGVLKRTKYFFGSRYLWSREQLKSPLAKIAGGIRRDVPKPPQWMKEIVEEPMVSASIAPANFVNAVALNMYHDGSEGIQSHYDDSKRFQQPIYSLRLFSDSRLSFGTQLYGFTNGLFFIPMPRGCITVMENEGFAANGVKHCVRPIDMTGKSAAIILRKINEKSFSIAEDLFWKESLHKLKSLSLDPVCPDQLVWNPLFSDNTDESQKTLRLKKATKQKTKIREKR